VTLAAQETAPAPRKTAAAPKQTVAASRALQVARASYGAALVLAPGVLIYLATGRFPGSRARRVARLLGARHLVQAAVAAFVPAPDVFVLGAEVDAVHAVSMALLAPAGGAAGRAATLDMLAEGAFAAAGLSCGRAAGT
jgi:hypothetical protein